VSRNGLYGLSMFQPDFAGLLIRYLYLRIAFTLKEQPPKRPGDGGARWKRLTMNSNTP
jgi:hypothetical protein